VHTNYRLYLEILKCSYTGFGARDILFYNSVISGHFNITSSMSLF